MPRKILVFDIQTQFTVTVPDKAKITFGPTIPYPARQQGVIRTPDERGYSLRIYEGNKENLLAVFPGVTGFRDMSLEIEEHEEAAPRDLEMSETGRNTEEAPRRRRGRPSRRTAPTPQPEAADAPSDPTERLRRVPTATATVIPSVSFDSVFGFGQGTTPTPPIMGGSLPTGIGNNGNTMGGGSTPTF